MVSTCLKVESCFVVLLLRSLVTTAPPMAHSSGTRGFIGCHDTQLSTVRDKMPQTAMKSCHLSRDDVDKLRRGRLVPKKNITFPITASTAKNHPVVSGS
jgi:hypothetical protein